MHAFYLRNINRTTRHISLCLTIMQFSNTSKICDFVQHTSVEDEQPLPEHNSNLNKKLKKIPFPVFP
jgi:hypothetical protein